MTTNSNAENNHSSTSSMTRKEFYSLMRQHGLKKNSRSLKEYEQAKKSILTNDVWNRKNYPRIHRWIADYIGI